MGPQINGSKWIVIHLNGFAVSKCIKISPKYMKVYSHMSNGPESVTMGPK